MTPGKGYRFLILLPLLGAFAVAIWQMRYDWTYDETYHYGWTVLPLALYLFSLRWRDRPLPGRMLSLGVLGTSWGVLAALYPLAWLVRGANPEWRLLGVVFAGMAVLTALLYLATHGGRNWLRHFAGPVLFFLTAIPWPSVLEKSAAALLMPANAVISLEVLHWLEVPAIRSGHLITLPNGTLGVEEACSGIRSLQSTLMMACFLGELNHLRWSPRLLLLGWGIAFALLTNVLRTVALSTAAARAGLDAVHDWHDAAGLLALGVNTLFLFLLTARFAKAKALVKAGEKPSETGAQGQPPMGAEPEAESGQNQAGIHRWGPATLALGLGLMLPVTGWWYGRNETAPSPRWQASPPTAAPSYRAAKIDQRTTIMLRYSDGWSARWTTPTGQPLHGFYFQWDQGQVPPENLNVHQPGNCLGALGITQVTEYPVIPVSPAGQLITARHLRFDDGGRPLHLLYLFSEDAEPLPSVTVGAFDFSYFKRFESVLQGRRNPGQRLIEIGLWDEPSEAAARATFEQFLKDWIRKDAER